MNVSAQRLLIAAFGDAGHAFPAIALGRALGRRGHEVVVETWERWRDAVEGEGLGFASAEQYRTFPPPVPGSGQGASAADAARALLPLLEELRPQVVVSDILTLAPALAAELVGIKRATLIPHVYTVEEPGLPLFGFGAHPPRTGLGRGAWRAGLPAFRWGLRWWRRELNQHREALGLTPVDGLHGALSEELTMVATFPQLEYRRSWPARVRVTGPMTFELPYPDVELPEGDDPLVVIAPSTAQDPERRLVSAGLEALADQPVRVVATMNQQDLGDPLPAAPANARVHPWLSYSQVMPRAALVICHGGHGTVARALSAGVPVLCCPAAGDMAENAARVAWAGAGLSVPWRLTRPATIRLATRRILRGSSFNERAREIAAWARRQDGAERGAQLVEGLGSS